MRFRAGTALASVFIAVLAAVAAPTVAHAASNDNSNASVAGVTAETVDANFRCGAGHFCLYTKPLLTGKAFRLYYCKTYSLSNWNGEGSWFNNNTGGAHGYLLDQNGNVLFDSDPEDKYDSYSFGYNFKPVWYVKAC